MSHIGRESRPAGAAMRDQRRGRGVRVMRRKSFLVKGAVAAAVIAGVCVAGASALPSHPAAAKETIKQCREDLGQANAAYAFAKQMEAFAAKHQILITPFGISTVQEETNYHVLEYV